MRVTCVVQARLGSSRLPGKSLKPLQGRSLISHVLERARAIRGVDRVVMATSVSELDTPLVTEAERLGFDVHRGSEGDVLSRFAGAVEQFGGDVVMRVTGDCPLLDPGIGADVLALYLADPQATPYVSNDTTQSGHPDGTDVEVFSRALLERTAGVATEPGDREHVTPWIRRSVPTSMLPCRLGDWRHLKISVDYLEDYERVQQIYAHAPADFSLAATLDAARRAGVIA
jgi:spore coat polysaccharide biosynthesis protein SpsF